MGASMRDFNSNKEGEQWSVLLPLTMECAITPSIAPRWSDGTTRSLRTLCKFGEWLSDDAGYTAVHTGNRLHRDMRIQL